MKNKIKLSSLIIIFFSILTCQEIFSQSLIMNNAFGGKKGIFIYFDKNIPFKSNEGEWFYYKIERRREDTKNWQTLDTIIAPSNFTELKNRVNSFHSKLSYLTIGNNETLNKIWNISKKYKVIDSLYYYAQIPVYGLALGTIYLDTSAKENISYEYRYLKISNTGKVLRSIRTFAVQYPGKASFKKITKKASRVDKNKIFIQWVTGSKKMPVFQVLREENLRPPYKLITPVKGINADKDSLNIFVRDTLVNPESIYRYYIIPEDIFGNAGDNSDTVIVGNYNFREVAALPDSIKAENAPLSGGIKLSWRPKKDPSVRFIDIYKSAKYDTGYVRLVSLSANQTSYLDQDVNPNVTYYYYLLAEGQLGETSTKSPRFFGVYADTEAPFPPLDVNGDGTKNGVKLQWTRNESFTRGYYVFRSSSVDGKLEQISQLIPAKDSLITYVDNDSTLSGQVTYAYAVKAENTSYVKSVFSDTVYVRPAISTKPLTPTDIKAMVNGNSASVFWDDMSALQDGIDGYDLLRKEINKNGKSAGDYVVVNDTIIPPYQNHFTDTKVERGKKYLYSVRSKDIFNGTSDLSNPVIIEVKKNPVIPPAGIAARKISGEIEISWDGAGQEDLAGYKVYRYERGKRPALLGTVKNGSELLFKDKKTIKSHLYFYYVTSYLLNGDESNPGSEVGIRF